MIMERHLAVALSMDNLSRMLGIVVIASVHHDHWSTSRAGLRRDAFESAGKFCGAIPGADDNRFRST